MRLGVKKSSFWFYSILLLILAYPFNVRVVAFLSVSDLLFILLFVLGFLFFGMKRTGVGWLVFFVLLFLFGSASYGIIFFGFATEYLAFFYKYGVVFLLSWFLLSAELDGFKIKILLKALFISYVFMVFYVFFHYYLVLSGYQAHLMPDFPFSEPSVSAYHLYGAYLSTGLITIISYWLFLGRQKMHSYIVIPAFTLISFIAVLLVGARAAFLSLSIGIFVIGSIFFVKTGLFAPPKKSLSALIIFACVGMIVVGIFPQYSYDLDRPFAAIRRATGISTIVAGADQSAMGRQVKFAQATDLTFNNTILFGTGVSSTSFTWVDNSIARLLIDAGFGGLFFFLLLIGMFIAQAYKIAKASGNLKVFYVFLMACATYFVNSISTEFFLVTRSIFPFLILTCLLYKLMSIPFVEK